LFCIFDLKKKKKKEPEIFIKIVNNTKQGKKPIIYMSNENLK
jgi:hypothetical protein